MTTYKKMPVKQITSWSMSRYNEYKNCPLKAKLKFIDKLKEPANEAMERGNTIHILAEDYIKGKIRNVPKELKLFQDLFKDLKKRFKSKLNPVHVEETWAFKSDWTETSWDDWNGCWLRVKVDCAFKESKDSDTLEIKDWKTGKFRPDNNDDYLEQLELYALGAFIKFPHINGIYASLTYLDEGVEYPSDNSIHFTRSDLPKLKKLWTNRVKAMMNDTVFPPKPNMWCTRCHFRKSGTGHCPF
jgi:PD-(D/E)XK nuclease superfamily